MPRYTLLIHGAEDEWTGYSDDEREAIYAEYRTLSDDLAAREMLLGGGELDLSTTATSVRLAPSGGGTAVSDGPYADVKEALGGFFLITAADMDEAVGVAARIPSARTGAIEVREVVEFSRE